jgi:AraC-like DNA-binding protein
MILIDFPAPNAHPVALDLICPELGWSNLIALTHTTPGYSPEVQGTLSIKCAYGGRENYLVGSDRMAVGNGTYLILNEGERYAGEVMGSRGVDSFCVFFRPGFAEETLRSLVEPDDQLLNDPEMRSAPVYFAEIPYRPDAILSPALDRLYDAVAKRRVTKGWIEEQFYDLARRMLEVHRGVVREMARLPVARRSTRIELYRRLARARDFMETSFAGQLNLATMAREAAMAPHHFLRLFKKTFGSTPHQYLTHLRLERARTLLATSDGSITQICMELGFESPTSFALLFKRHTGASPSAYRAAFRRGIEGGSEPA